MANDLMIPEVVALQKKYEESLPAIRGHFEHRLVEQVRSKRNWLYGGALVGVGVTLSGTGFAILNAMIALASGGLVAGLTLVGGFVVWQMLPRWQLQIANSEKLKIDQEMHAYILHRMRTRDEQINAIQEEVRRNPIAFLEADYRRRKELYEAQRVVVTRFAGRVETHVQNFNRRKRDRPRMDFSGEETAIERMKLFHQNRMERLNNGFQLLNRFADKIEEARTRWELKRSAAEALADERDLDLDAAFQEVLSDIAFDTVNSEFQMVFAQIEVDAQEMASKKLEFAPNMSIDVTETKAIAQ
jgi:hypothetical protein